MAYTFNGIGTSVCPGRGLTAWGGLPDADALECVTVFYVPVYPYRAVHVFNGDGTTYEQIPIRWSPALVLHALGRRWLGTILVAGVIAAVVGAFEAFNTRARNPMLGLRLGCVAVALAAGSCLGWAALRLLDRRTRAIRRLLGRHVFGSSDPACWTAPLLARVPPPGKAFGTATYADAVLPLLVLGDFGRAMWAARLAVALENPAVGEALTDAILEHPDSVLARHASRLSGVGWTPDMQPTPR